MKESFTRQLIQVMERAKKVSSQLDKTAQRKGLKQEDADRQYHEFNAGEQKYLQINETERQGLLRQDLQLITEPREDLNKVKQQSRTP